MATESGNTPMGTVSFRLGLLGVAQDALYATRLAELDLKPKHVSLLCVLRLRGAGSQMELAGLLGVAPSLVVLLADHLEGLGAIQRVRDPADRRRQSLRLTEAGLRLLDEATEAAAKLDQEIAACLPPADQAALSSALDRLLDLRNGFGRRGDLQTDHVGFFGP
ncbi:MarR family winged helix-turn-helix transcriptional regulator [Actinoplanes sp. M2I2]|uniref:MarR family winged helix-turn-helix transcriptional regulator n=1 Tax=Actinoplanes sp. M2I2 TaxID=1734444 RepID=UPI002021FFF9|nr:MarR family winged helix-turn-helix transcriptional regulator [Actinoplanes sp. M2I2]